MKTSRAIKRDRWPEIIDFLRINLRASNTPYLFYLEEEKKKKDLVKCLEKLQLSNQINSINGIVKL